jgi:streptogramin lyase
MRRSLATLGICFFIAGCSIHGATSTPSGPAMTRPQAVQKGGGAQFVQFNSHSLGNINSAIVSGPDGNLWFLDEGAGGLVRMSMGGSTKEFSLSNFLGSYAVSMAVGADDKFYILNESTSVTRVTTSGSATAFPIPSGDNTAIDGLALGPDGNVWFAEFSHIAKITPTGKITEFSYPSGINQYGGVTAGSDGNIWFAQSTQNAIGRITPSGTITMFPISVTCLPAAVVLAKDNNLWFACLTSRPLVGRITPGGTITTYPIGGVFNSNETEQFGARGPDGEPWFASGNDNTVFRINTANQTATTFNPPLGSGERPDALSPARDGNIWIDTVGGGHIDVLVFNPMKVTPTKLTFTMTGQMTSVTLSEHGTSSWTATSSNTAVATVAQGNKNNVFNVTSVGVGSCKINIADANGNSVNVKVTVQ